MVARQNTVLTTLSGAQIKSFYAAGYWREETIYDYARRNVQARPGSFAIRDRNRRLTYDELVGFADALAGKLERAGVQAGQRVGVWTSSRVETAIAWLACSRNRYVCCPSLHRDHTVGDVTKLLERVGAAAFIGEAGWGADAERFDVFSDVAKQEGMMLVIRLTADGASELVSNQDPSDSEPSSDPDRVVYLAFTSGTTGEPKGVLHSDNTLLANARAIAADWKFGPESVLYTMSPLSHNLGLGAMIAAFASGGELVVHDLPRGRSLLERLEETRATFLFGVPTHAIDLLSELRARGGSGRIGCLEGFRVSGARHHPR